MDITLQVLIEPAAHLSGASRYKRGSILNIYPADKYAVLGGDGNYTMQSQMANSKFAWIHIKNAPDRDLNKVREVLISTIDKEVEGLFQGRNYFIETILLRRRKFRFVLSQIPQAIRDQILADREYTVEWSTVKNFIRKVIVNNEEDDSLDDESTLLVDGDLD